MDGPSPRQFARVQPPGIVNLDDHRFRLIDISAGGFGFECNGHAFRPGDCFKGELVVNVGGVPVSLPARFEVRNFDARSGRAGAAFCELGEPGTSRLRQLIKSHLPERASDGAGIAKSAPAGAVVVPHRAHAAGLRAPQRAS